MDALDKMTKWCQANALKSLDDKVDVLQVMKDAYSANNSDNNDILLEEPNMINGYMDVMVIRLVRTFGDKLAFKGGYMLTKLMPKFARQTTDIDFSIQSSELYNSLINEMDEIGEDFISKGYISSYRIKKSIEKHMSGGMDMYDISGRKVLGIDIGWHDITFGTVVTSIDIGDINAFSIERMLADKITAILSRKRFRRPKDVYDLYCISNCFDFDLQLVNEYILRRTEGKGAEWDNYPFSEQVLIEYRKAYDKLSLNSMYKGVTLQKPRFEDVMSRFSNICESLMAGVTGNWNHEKEIFE